MTEGKKSRKPAPSGVQSKGTASKGKKPENKKATAGAEAKTEKAHPQSEPEATTYASFENGSTTESKPESKMAIVIAIMVTLVIAVVATILVMSLVDSDSANDSSSNERAGSQAGASGFVQNDSAGLDEEATSQLEGQWVEVTLTTGERYFARMKEAHDLGGYLLWNVWYPLNVEDDFAQWQRVGDEIHQPRPFIVLSSSAVRTWQQLASDSEVLMEISALEDFADISEPQQDEILDAAGHAVFLADGTVLFGILVHDGDRIGVQDGYYLVRTDIEAAATDPIESLDDLQLVTQRSATSGLLNTLWVGSDMLVMYQALGDDSRIIRAIQEAR
ncbi:MAG: hypothetical protein FWE48_06370 [Coriobacteriia bacterium]|nr:hypothetical protein [Coriobacteriia bacterium]